MRMVDIIPNIFISLLNIIISQGSGGNVTIPNGQTKIVYLDGAGSGAAVNDAGFSTSAGASKGFAIAMAIVFG